MIEAGYYSFFNWNGYGTPTDFVGLRNYEQLIGQKIFHSALWNNVLVIVVSLLVQLPLAMTMALIVAEKMPGSYLFRTIFFLPYILAEIAAGLIWKFIYDGENGLIAAIFGWFGAQAPFLLASREWAFSAILVVLVWKYFGWHMMIFIAGIQNISEEVVEAARMDGATRRQINWYRQDPPAVSDDPAVGLLLGARLATALRPDHPAHRRRTRQLQSLGGELSVLLRHGPDEDRFRQRRRCDPVHPLCRVCLHLPQDVDAP